MHQVAAALLANGLEPRQLCLEATESTLMHRLDGALSVMAELRELTPEQLAQLRNLGREFGQGCLLARPLTPELAAATALVDLRRADAGAPPLPTPGSQHTLPPMSAAPNWPHTAPSPLALH